MAFSAFSGQAQAVSNAEVQLGPELPDITSDEVGFLSIAGGSRVQLLPTPWPADSLPPPTSSLLSVASSKELVAAAGPDGIVIGNTDAIRAAFSAERIGDSDVRPFQAQLKISLPAPVTHVAFSSDDNVLVVAAGDGSGLAAYQETGLRQGNTQPALTFSTNGASLRALSPNPNPAMAELFAAVTTNGDLLMANLKTAELVQGANGPVLLSGVSSVSWSNKGKQLVAGLADGAALQITPEGQHKAQIPRPPDLEAGQHISSLAWLENDMFFLVYTPTSSPDDLPSSSYYIATRTPKTEQYTFRRLPEATFPAGLNRTPQYQFIARLRGFEPNLKDALMIASTASTDVGLYTRSTKPLTDAFPDNEAPDVFTNTGVGEDMLRAVLPMNKEGDTDTSAIGLALDFSSKDPVPRPLHNDKTIERSNTPLPNLLLLNNEGVLCSWWFIYADSIRENKAYHELISVKGEQQSAATVQATPPPAPQQKPNPFGQQGFGTTTPFGKPAGPSFGTPSFGTPSFGTPAPLGSNRAQPAFGAPSALGGSKTPAGLPAFGAVSSMGSTAPAFGSPSALGQKASGTAFGQSSTLGGFGAFSRPSTTPTSSPSAGGGFSSFASKGGFAEIASGQSKGESPFARPAADNPFGKQNGPSTFGQPSTTPFGRPSAPFGSVADTTSSTIPFGKPAAPFGSQTDTTSSTSPFAKPGVAFGSQADATTSTTPFGKPGAAFSSLSSVEAPSKPADPSKGLFGVGSGGFALGSSFKGDGTAASDGPKIEKGPGAFSLASSFGNMLGDVSKPAPSTETNNGTEAEIAKPEPTPVLGKAQEMKQEGPPAKLEVKKEEPAKPANAGSPFNLFGQRQPSTAAGGFGGTIRSPPVSKEDSATPTPSQEKQSGDAESTPIANNAEPPLPPDPTSRAAYGPGDTSASSSNVSSVSKLSATDAPLPPDFLPTKKAPPVEKDVPVALPEGPEDDLSEDEGSEFDDSGEEISPPGSPAEEEKSGNNNNSFKSSPESSFGGAPEKSPAGGLFTKISVAEGQQQRTARPLFGEVQGSGIPPLKPRLDQASPRSPSPVRSGLRRDLIRSEPLRSSSAPGSSLAGRKAILADAATPPHSQSPLAEDLIKEEQEKEIMQRARKMASEIQTLAVDDEDEERRADLARPVSPAPTLDPFLPHQDYVGDNVKPGIAGQIERLYRDMNSMVDTLGINARSLTAFVMFQESSIEPNYDRWMEILQSDQPANILDEEFRIADISMLEQGIDMLDQALERGRVRGVDEKLDVCKRLLGRDIPNLRAQLANIRRTIDGHSENATTLSTPLSAEQASLQQDLRNLWMKRQAQLAELESNISLLKAKIADCPPADSANGPPRSRKPTVEAVTSTITTMTNMAEKKSGDIDVLEAQLKKLGLVNPLGDEPSGGGSPFRTPSKKVHHFPATPGSRGSRDDGVRSIYHTPESARMGTKFRGSISGSTLKSMNRVDDATTSEEVERWNSRARRRNEIVGHFKAALAKRKPRVRGMDDA